MDVVRGARQAGSILAGSVPPATPLGAGAGPDRRVYVAVEVTGLRVVDTARVRRALQLQGPKGRIAFGLAGAEPPGSRPPSVAQAQQFLDDLPQLLLSRDYLVPPADKRWRRLVDALRSGKDGVQQLGPIGEAFPPRPSVASRAIEAVRKSPPTKGQGRRV